jgi:Skp family chaperone for outer membrane proteins
MAPFYPATAVPFYSAIDTREFAAEIETAKNRDAGEFHALKSEHVTDRQQLQKSIRLMQEKHRREREKARATLGYWLTLDRSSLRSELEAHQSELQGKQSSGRTRRRIQSRKRDQGLEP